MTQKIVEFMAYCNKCVHCDKAEIEEPCDTCISEAAREDSHKPIKFEPKDEYKDIVPYKEVK